MNADDLIAFRKRLGLSQQKAAELMGCSPRSISNWEKGVNKIPDSIALAASAVGRDIGTGDSATSTGGLELVAMEMKEGSHRIADAINNLSEAIRECK